MPKSHKRRTKLNRLHFLALARAKNPKNIKANESKNAVAPPDPLPKPRKRKVKECSSEPCRILPFRACINEHVKYAEKGPPRGLRGGFTKKARCLKALQSKRQKNRVKNSKRNQNLAAETRKRQETVREIAKIAHEKLKRVSNHCRFLVY